MEQKRTRRTFDPSFKHHAALRVVEGKEKAAAVAADLGINIVSLYNWVKDYEKTKATAIANAQSQAAQAAESAPTTQTPVETSSPIESPAAEAPRRPKLQLKKRPPETTEAAAPTAVTPAAAAPAPVSPAPAVSMPALAPTFSNEPRVFSPTPEPTVQETRSAPEVKEPAFETPHIPNFLQTTADAKTSSSVIKETAETLCFKERCAAEMQVRMKRPCTTRLFRAPWTTP